MYRFRALHHGEDEFGLATLLETFANDQWIGEHYTSEQAVDVLLDRFRRALLNELEMVELGIDDSFKGQS